jgi:hypothetical protein
VFSSGEISTQRPRPPPARADRRSGSPARIRDTLLGLEILLGEAMSTARPKTAPSQPPSLNLSELIPDLFDRYFAFFRPGHQEGVVPSRIKELARLKIAALNDCDT